MKQNITNDPKFNGTYYTPDEYEKMKQGIFKQDAQSMIDARTLKEIDIPARYYIVVVFKDGDTFETTAWLTPATGISPSEAFKLYLKDIDITRSLRKNHTGQWQAFDAFMPRTKVPEAFEGYLKHIKS